MNGIKDGIRFPQAIKTLLQYGIEHKFYFLCFITNIGISLGVELLYQLGHVFQSKFEHPDDGLLAHYTVRTFILQITSMGLNVFHFFWTVGIWVVSFGFSTIWVQKIHDSLMAKKV